MQTATVEMPTKRTVPKKPRAVSLAKIGREAAHKAQREALLAALEAHDWHLSAVAKATGLHNASNVIRSIRTLGLTEEYEAAKADGKIPKGPRE